MAEQANDEILQLAGQGNLQALSVYLNRHLIPSGAHVKIKQKDNALHVLIVVMRESDNSELIHSVQQLLTRLQPAHIKRVKVYTQILGHKQANLRHQFALETIPQPKASGMTTPTSTPPPLPSPERRGRPTVHSMPGAGVPVPPVAAAPPVPSNGKVSQSVSKAFESMGARPNQPQKRYSVAEFLSQATNIEDLKVLHNHPFFTGTCPHCRYRFPEAGSPPTYWDCPKCGWQDDLSALMPSQEKHRDINQTSLTESKRLGDYLVEAGLLTASQIEVALADQMTTNLRFGEVLVRRGWLKEETIEYLMKKIIVPERSGTHNEASYLESSRNLLKTLLKAKPGASGNQSLFINPPPTAPKATPMGSGAAAASDVRPPRNPSPPAAPAPGKLPNERETLILPDAELDELDAYLKNGL